MAHSTLEAVLRGRGVSREAHAFCSWDGEGVGDKYIVFANSAQPEKTLANRSGLSSWDCLRLILDSPDGYTHVAYGFNYDVHMILGDLPLRGQYGSMQQLYEQGETLWRGLHIEWVPRKWFRVSNRPPKKGAADKRITRTIFDTIGFFQRSLEKALKYYGVAYSELLSEGKKGREDFHDEVGWPLSRIVAYNAEELEKHVKLMEFMDAADSRAHLSLSSFHGGGAWAAAWLRRERIAEHIQKLPPRIEKAAKHGYFGGRIEVAGIGEVKHIYNYDLQGAYAWALTNCPSLVDIEWRWGELQPDTPFQLCHVKWDIPEAGEGEAGVWYPFPYRQPSGTILFPRKGEGWYWAPEVYAALGGPYRDYIRVLECWYPAEAPSVFPFRLGIERDYRRRTYLRAIPDPAEYAIKTAINSNYGKLAQKIIGRYAKRRSKSGKPAGWQCYAWAGYITSQIRAALYKAIAAVPSHAVISCMTDGIWATQPLPQLDVSPGLGHFTLEHEGEKCYVLGAGVYGCYRREGRKWVESENKQRGFGSAEIPHSRVWKEWRRGVLSYRTTVRRFVGAGLALQTDSPYRQWQDFERQLENPLLVGNTKRIPPWTTEELADVVWLIPRENDSDELSMIYKTEEIDPAARRVKLEEECAEEGEYVA